MDDYTKLNKIIRSHYVSIYQLYENIQARVNRARVNVKYASKLLGYKYFCCFATAFTSLLCESEAPANRRCA